MKIWFILLLFFQSLFANELQDAINNSNSGDIIELSEGIYQGSIIINKPITIDGINQKAIIDGGGRGSVIKINSPYVTIKNLIIQNSGNSHINLDSGINVNNAHHINIHNNIIKNSLFGIDFKQTHDSNISNNKISSKPTSLGLRGDSIRLWYSHSNEITENDILNSRDLILWYSSSNIIARNYGKNCRYSLHFMYAGANLIEDNIFENNTVGIFFMFSEGSIARRNIVKNAIGAFGVGIGMKDTSDFKIYDNKLIYNARGFYIDQSPFQPNKINYYEKNEILYNTIGIQFHATQHKSIFKNNIFKGNVEIAFNDTPESKLNLNEWNGNYFDSYDGLDRNKDGIGDIAYKHYIYADKLWQYKPNIRFFYGSSAISILNFLSKLAPFSEPILLLTDFSPRMKDTL